MDTISWSEGTPSQAFGLQASNSTMQNDTRYQCFMPGEQINGNQNMYGSHTQLTQHADYHSAHYTSHSGQTANGNYWNDKATDLNSVRNRDGFAAHRSGSGFSEPVPQLPLRNQTLMNGNGSCIAQSRPYLPQSHYAPHQNPLKTDVPQTVMANRTNTHLAPSAIGGIPHTQETLQFSRVGSGAPPSGTQAHGDDLTAIEHINRITNFLMGESVNPSANVYSSLEGNPNHHYLQATVGMGQGVMSRADGTVKKSNRKSMKGSNGAVAPPTGDITSLENVLVDRGKGIRENLPSAIFSSVGQHANPSYLQGLLSRSQGSVARTPAGTACPPSGQSSCWSAGPGVNAVKGTGSGSGTGSKERTNNIQPRSCAAGNYFSKVNPSYYSVNRDKSVSQVGALGSGSGNSLPVQNAMERQPSSHFPSSTAAGNFSAHSRCTEGQSRHFPPTDHQLPGAQNPMRVQEAQCRTQSYNGKEQQFFIPKTLNGGVAAATRHVGPAQIAKPAPNQIPQSNFESQNGHPHALGSGYRFTSTLPNEATQPHRLMPDNQPSGNPPPYPKTQRYFVTVTQDRPGTGFTAKNVIFMTDNHACALSEQLQLTSKEGPAKLDSGVAYGELSGSSDPKNCETQLLTAITRAESVFSMPKPTNQQKGTGSSGQRAVAVVPPISQQSSNSADVGSGIINTNEGLPFKIKNVWSLAEEEYATQQKIDSAVSVTVSHGTGSDENLKQNIFTSVPATHVDSSSPSEQASSPLQQTAQAPDLVSPSIYTTDALAVAEKDIEKSNPPDLQPKTPEVAHQTEKISSFNVNNSETLPSLSVIESGDQNGESKENTFDLSSVPVFKWTISKLYKLMSLLEWRQGPLQVEMDLEKLHGIYGSCSYPDVSDVFSSDLYMSIMNEASSISPEYKHAVIFSQVKKSYHKAVRENCHIVTHDATFSEDVVYKSSWLNLNEQLDDIDKEHGLPLHLRLRRHTLEEKCEDKEVNESDSGNLPPVLTKAELPASSEHVSHSKDPLSTIKINVLPSEVEVNETENGNLPEAPIAQEAEERLVSQPPTQTELPAPEEEGVSDFTDPLSCIEINVLSGEEARRFFNEITEEAEDLQSELPKPDSKEKETQMDAESPERPVKEGEKSQMEVYCCLARWLCVMTGYGNKSVCSCQREDESNQEKRESGASKNSNGVVPAPSPPGRGPVGTAQSEHSTGTADSCGEKNAKGAPDKCAVPEHKSVVNPGREDSRCRATGGNGGPPSVQKVEMRRKTPSDQSGVENQAHPETAPTSALSGSNVTEVKIQALHSSYNKALKASSVVAPLWTPPPPQANVDGHAISSGSRGTRKASLGCNEVGAKCGTFGQQVGSPDAKGLNRRVHVHKRQTSSENHNRKDDNVAKRESKRRKRKWEISNPRSSALDRSASDLEERNKKKKKRKTSHPQAIPEIKTTVVEHKSRTSRQEKRKGDLHSESLGPTVPKRAKSERPRNGPANNSEKGKMPRNANVLLVLSKRQEKASSVSLALYGSSPQKRTGTLHSQGRVDSKPVKIKSSAGTTPRPPATVSFPSEKTDPFQHCPPVKSLAKQQVFAKWKSSLVPAKDGRQTKPHSSKNGKNGAKIPRVTPTTHPNNPKPPTSQTSAPLLSQPLVTPIKLKAVTVCPKKSKNRKSSTFKSTENELYSKPVDHTASKITSTTKRRVTTEGRQCNSTERPLFPLKVRLERIKPKKVEQRRSTVPDTQMKSKFELGNPALIALQQDGMLEFKLLPESFNFKDGQDHREPVKPKEVKRTVSAKIGRQQSESLKMSTWKRQDSWSKSSKDLTSTEVRSPGAETTHSGTTFQTYKKMYMAKGKI
ncbi:hypothetical protein ANANG_G00313410 [Anguilla anguilla]|uniref:Uncharacterized protein n=1 Tax=Anguilla anguilla TaxID=7936 RepID=A0A9D3RI49_ANGAN|nr:hypothetical protein ANANG_G00313410 [Anguilla anguilla]